MITPKAVEGEPKTAKLVDFPTLLFDVLGYTRDEYVSICHQPRGGGFHPEVCQSVRGTAKVAELPKDSHIWFGVNPVSGPPRVGAKGGAADVTRPAALFADIDVKPGACPNLAVANAIIDDVSEVLGTRPYAVTSSGGGLQPYWPIADGVINGDVDVAALYRRYGRLVQAVAKKHGAATDSVFNLDRILRAPGTYNCKPAYANAATNGHVGVPVVCRRDTGRALTLAEIAARLDEARIPEEDSDRGDSGRVVSNPESWEPAHYTHGYVVAWIEGIPEDHPNEGGGRHAWMLSQAVRINCAMALGYISETDYLNAQGLVEDRLRELRAETGETVPPWEVSAAWVYAIEKVSRKTLDQLWADLRADRNMWSPPDDPYPCAERVVREAKLTGYPLCYYSGDMYRWVGTHYQRLTSAVLRDYLGRILRDAKYVGAKAVTLRWKPDTAKLNKVFDAARAYTRLLGDEGAEREAPVWLDGHDEPVMACRNGLVRVADRIMLPHSADYFNVMSLPFDYDAGALCPRWMRFLEEVLPDAETAAVLQKWFGYVITGRTDFEQFMVLIGPSRGGKGTIVHVLENLIGTVYCEGLGGNHFRNDFAYQSLLGKHLATLSDSQVTFNKALVEAILRITGHDRITVNRKNQESVSCHLPTRLMILTNVPPVLPDDAGAIDRRMVAISVPKSFDGKGGNPKPDTGLKEYLVRNELPGIFVWALEGAQKLIGLERLPQPRSGERLRAAINESSSPVTQFVKEWCEWGKGDDGKAKWEYKNVMYKAWCLWCDENGHQPGAVENLSRKLIAAMPNVARDVDFNHKGKRGRSGQQRPAYIGLRLRKDERQRVEIAIRPTKMKFRVPNDEDLA
jgi:putative DNA primase/helicase